MIKRILSIIKGRISLLLSKKEVTKTQQLLLNAKNDLRNLRHNNIQLLMDLISTSERIKLQISSLEKKYDSLNTSVKLLIENEDNVKAASQALLLEELSVELNEKKSTLAKNEYSFNELLSLSKLREDEISRDIEQLSYLVCKSEAEKAKELLTTSLFTSSNKSFTELASHTNSLNHSIKSQHSKSKARIIVAKDLIANLFNDSNEDKKKL
jgi:hypothetical protein